MISWFVACVSVEANVGFLLCVTVFLLEILNFFFRVCCFTMCYEKTFSGHVTLTPSCASCPLPEFDKFCVIISLNMFSVPLIFTSVLYNVALAFLFSSLLLSLLFMFFETSFMLSRGPCRAPGSFTVRQKSRQVPTVTDPRLRYVHSALSADLLLL